LRTTKPKSDIPAAPKELLFLPVETVVTLTELSAKHKVVSGQIVHGARILCVTHGTHGDLNWVSFAATTAIAGVDRGNPQE
jgi:hypothetical protein